jgi:putative endonuclease
MGCPFHRSISRELVGEPTSCQAAKQWNLSGRADEPQEARMISRPRRIASAWSRRWKWIGRRRRSLGDRGERWAERYLRRRGMKIVGRKERCGGGELDLIAVDGRTIVFVEVKTRRSLAGGHPLEAVTRQKQRRIIRAALAYLHRHHLLECSVRFDVVAIVLPSRDRWWARPQITHVRNAFEPEGTGQFYC